MNAEYSAILSKKINQQNINTMSKEYDTTQRVLRLLLKETKEEVAKEIGISRPTLDARLKFHSWKKSEITLIKTL